MDALTPENLAKYDVLLVYANHQEITEAQFAAVKGFVEGGGGFVPVHCGSACFKKHDGYVALVGGQIEGHGDGVFTAALAAIVVPDLLLSNGQLAITWTNPKLMAGLGAAVFFLATRHLLGTIIAGMALFTLLRVML